MRIAFDLDGVLADLHTPFVQMALRLYPELDTGAVRSPDIGASPPDVEGDEPDPEVVPPGASGNSLALTSAQTNRVWQALTRTENFWETLEELEPGAIAKLARMAETRRWELLFITSRPHAAGLTVQRQSQRWLEQHGFSMPSVYTVHGSRGLIAKALHIDIVVDDRPENCLDVALESGAGAILVWRGFNERVPVSARRMGIAVVRTVAECLDAIAKLDDAGQKSGLLDRLRQFFGLRTYRPAQTADRS